MTGPRAQQHTTGGTMAAPLVLMGDTCNRIRVRTPGGGTTWGDGTPVPPPKLSLSCPTPSNLHKTRSLLWRDGCLPTMMFTGFEPTECVCRFRKTSAENQIICIFGFYILMRHFAVLVFMRQFLSWLDKLKSEWKSSLKQTFPSS